MCITEAARLDSALQQIISKEPKNSLEIRSHWNALVGKDLTLARHRPEKVIPFLGSPLSRCFMASG